MWCSPPSNGGHKDHCIFRLGDPELNPYFPLYNIIHIYIYEFYSLHNFAT